MPTEAGPDDPAPVASRKHGVGIDKGWGRAREAPWTASAPGNRYQVRPNARPSQLKRPRLIAGALTLVRENEATLMIVVNRSHYRFIGRRPTFKTLESCLNKWSR